MTRALKILVSTWLALAPAASATITPVDLRCEGQPGPIAAPAAPRLSWRVESDARGALQTAWQIVAASSAEKLATGKPDMWDTGKVAATRLQQVTYQGQALEPGQSCYWQVRVWDAADEPSPWSTVARWDAAPTTPAQWRGARWIDDGKANPTNDEDFYQDDPAPLLRREFHLDKPVKRARLHIAGLGLSYPSLNGRRVDDQLFDPPWTNFDKRILYRTHDVTAQLKPGSNCIGITLGNGWFNPLPLRMWGGRNIRDSLPLGRPRAIALLLVEHPDGSQTAITTGPGWKTTEGPTLRNSIYLGEVRDARLTIPGWDTVGHNDSQWKAAQLVDAPLEPLQPLTRMHPVRSHETLRPAAITTPVAGTHIVDFGTNFTGLPEITLNVPAGTRIQLRFGELLHDDGTLNPMTSICGQIKGMIENQDGSKRPKGGPGAPEFAWQADTYIARGGGPETYRPDFTFHAFRYMEITGLPAAPQAGDIRALVFNTELPVAGTFESSNPLLNRIQQLCLRTFRANAMTVQSDCPHRERFGYGGDIAATSEAFMMNFDMAGFYAKTVRDWGDAQQPGGLMPDTAPYVGIKYCGVGWGMAHPLLVEQLYQHYGDIDLLKEQLPVALRWIQAEADRRENGLVTVGLGDHEAIGTKSSSRSDAIRTPKFIDAARRVARLARLARIAGMDNEAAHCDALADESQQAWQAAFLDPQTGRVVGNSQTELSFALGFGAVPPASRGKVFDQLVGQLTGSADGPQLTTGIYGTWKLLELLPAFGRNDLAYGLATREAFPSWGWMLKNGATTLWEHWGFSDGTFSHNHPMFGSISAWYFRWLGGIQPAPDAVAFDRILIVPQPVKGLEWVRTSHESARGTIISNWKQSADSVSYEITVPANTTAEVILPVRQENLSESGTPVASASGVEIVGPTHSGSLRLRVGGGSYHFTATR